jgi:hypothetical protein
VRAALDANPTAPDHGEGQTDAKVRPARPVHHRDAEEMFCPVRRHRRQEAEVASVDQVADLVAAVRHNFRESFPVQDRDYRLSASAAAEVYSVALRAHPKLLPVAGQSAGRALGVRIVPVGRAVPVEKVVVHPDSDWSPALLGVAHPKAARIAGAMAHRVEVPADAELQADAEVQALARLELLTESEPLAQPELLPAPARQVSPQREREWQQMAAAAQAQRRPLEEQASELPPVLERAQLEQPAQLASAPEQPPLAAELQEQALLLRALARLELPGVVEPLWPLPLSHPCPP